MEQWPDLTGRAGSRSPQDPARRAVPCRTHGTVFVQTSRRTADTSL